MQNAQITRELFELEQRYWQALKDGDAATAAELTDDSFIVAGAQGVARFGREAIGSMVRQTSYRLSDFRLSDEVADMLDDNVAVIAYKAHEDLIVDDAPVSLDVLESSTWVRRDGHWRCAAHTETVAGDPFGRDRVTSASY